MSVNGDTAVEPDETFFVNLTNPTGASVLDGQGVGTIANDDQALGVADVDISKIDTPDPVALGGTLTYHLHVINWGPDPATDVVLTDPLPPDVTFVSATPSTGACDTTSTPGTVSCTIGTLARFQDETVAIVVAGQALGDEADEYGVRFDDRGRSGLGEQHRDGHNRRRRDGESVADEVRRTGSGGRRTAAPPTPSPSRTAVRRRRAVCR